MRRASGSVRALAAAAASVILMSALLLLQQADAFLVGLPARAGAARASPVAVPASSRPLQRVAAADSCAPGTRRRLAVVTRMSSEMEEEMILTPENAEAVIDMARKELGTLFGYTKENQEVGITGEVDFVDLDGISIIVDLKGRFWHDRKMVLARVEKFVQNRIPECFEVRVSDPRQLEGGNDDQQSVEQFYRH